MVNGITHDFDSFFILCATELVGWSQFADFRGKGKVFLKLLFRLIRVDAAFGKL